MVSEARRRLCNSINRSEVGILHNNNNNNNNNNQRSSLFLFSSLLFTSLPFSFVIFLFFVGWLDAASAGAKWSFYFYFFFVLEESYVSSSSPIFIGKATSRDLQYESDITSTSGSK
jgi:ATP-dependent Zn protease